MNIDNALNKLTESERGTEALKAWLDLWENGGCSLDDGNWFALEMLCRSMYTSDGTISIIDKIRETLDET